MLKYKQINLPDKIVKVKLNQKGLSNCHSFALNINSIIFDEERYIKQLGEKIEVIDETLPFKDTMGFYTIDTKFKPRPVTALVASERDTDLWVKLMNTNSDFELLFNKFCHLMLNFSREHNKGTAVVLYEPDTKYGKQINWNCNYFFNRTKKVSRVKS